MAEQPGEGSDIYTQSGIRVIGKNAMAQKMLMVAVLVILGTKMATVTVANPICPVLLTSTTPLSNCKTIAVTLSNKRPSYSKAASLTTLLCLLLSTSPSMELLGSLVSAVSLMRSTAASPVSVSSHPLYFIETIKNQPLYRFRQRG
ncbi:hypothetical protein GOBAR_DD29666 [Gossypium barbadense]|nr:hypothetical protein GOBAR_DD29666 [Gossypium barbadense]